MVRILRRASARAARAAAEHPESSASLPTQMPAVVLLRDELEIDGTRGAVTVLDLEAHVRKDKSIAIDVEALRLRHSEPRVPIGLPTRSSLLNRPVCGPF